MKSWYYITIFIVVFVVVGGLLLYNASTVYDVPNNEIVIAKKNTTAIDEDVVVEQKNIDVLADEDFEADELDFIEDNISDFDNIDNLITINDDVVEF